MTHYVVNTKKQQQAMLEAIGHDSFDSLFKAAGVSSCLKQPLALNTGISEFEAFDQLKALADQNIVFKHIYRGAGSYHHYIPSVVKHLAGREEFVTAYTPYQAEISQGILQAIFEYQTMICELTKMDVSNASVYDGASAAAEAINMCVDKANAKVMFSAALNPEIKNTIKTYYQFSDIELIEIPLVDGITDLAKTSNSSEVACIVIQYPNYYGLIEDIKAIKEHFIQAKLIVIANPISLGLLEAPGALGADIVVGEGQPLGIPLSFGGPYLGFMATKKELVRRLPGRIVGETSDVNQNRAFTLTLQAREQHIRREKASSSICTNQALCALTSAIYLSAVGPVGLYEIADACYQNAHYLYDELVKIGFKPIYDQPFFHEFVLETKGDQEKLLTHLQQNSILAGYPLDQKHLLWCATEVNDKDQIDNLIKCIKEVC